VLVEAAFVFPVFMLLLFGMIEFGFIFKDSLTLSSMVQTGARTGAVVGNGTSPSADYEILSTMDAGSPSLNSTIQSIIIFDANSATTPGSPVSTVPTACVSAASAGAAGVPGVCNVYDAAQWSQIVSGTETGQDFTGSPSCSASCWDADWPPTARQVSEDSNPDANGVGTGPDFLGVYISASHKNLTGFFPSVTLHETDIIRIEPQSFS